MEIIKKYMTMVQEHVEKHKNCPWVMIIIGVVLLVLGFVLDALTIKMLWIIIAIAAIALGGFFFYISQKKKAPPAE